jgi:hypothetical protein
MLSCSFCRRCKKFVMAGFFCACIAAGEAGAHTHIEQYSPPPQVRALATVTSTATSSGAGYRSIFYRITPPST